MFLVYGDSNPCWILLCASVREGTSGAAAWYVYCPSAVIPRGGPCTTQHGRRYYYYDYFDLNERQRPKANGFYNKARDRLWNLSRDYYGLTHHFVTLHNGFRFHYLSNAEAETSSSSTSSTPATKPLLILIHGFPDSWAVWRYIVASESLQKTANIVAVDLPGYGGSDDLDTYSATNVLENLANFIIAVRTKYGIDTNEAAGLNRTVVMGHDWGCVLSMRLAAEAPELADRFILSNGPLVCFPMRNIYARMGAGLGQWLIGSS